LLLAAFISVDPRLRWFVSSAASAFSGVKTAYIFPAISMRGPQLDALL
jgi:hypothetical protein